jgi:hypothetical protein
MIIAAGSPASIGQRSGTGKQVGVRQRSETSADELVEMITGLR